MSQHRISPGVVQEELCKLLDSVEFCLDESPGKKKAMEKKTLAYIAGAKDMANAIIRRYKEGSKLK